MTLINIGISIFIGIITFTIFSIYYLQFRFIYLSWVPINSRTHVERPDAYQIPYEEVTLFTPDGVSLHAYLIIHNDLCPTLIYFHANAGNMVFFYLKRYFVFYLLSRDIVFPLSNVFIMMYNVMS